jgi:hypothetical protein
MDGSMRVSYHQFTLVDTGRSAGSWIRIENGLVGVGTGAAIIYTGIHTGVVMLSVEARDTPPESVDLDGWDEVVDVSLTAPAGQLKPAALMDRTDPFPELTVAGPGDYRVRVHASGRDANVDGVDSEPRERYLVIVWPQPSGPERVHRRTDAYGESVRRSFAGAPRIPEPAPDPHQARIDDFLRRSREQFPR